MSCEGEHKTNAATRLHLNRHLAPAKALFQECQAEFWLWRYRRASKASGVLGLEGKALKDALRARLALRRGKVSPKPKGELHVFLAYCRQSWEEILPVSLRSFGWVTEFEWRSRGFDDGAPDWLPRREVMNREMLAAFRAAHARHPVDAVVGYLSGHNTAPEVLTEMARSGAVIFNFCLDDKLHFPGRKLGGRYTSPAAIAPAVDLNLTNAPASIIKYAVHGGLALFWPEAAEPAIHRPHDGPLEFDVSFVGARYGWRPVLVEHLRRQGIKVVCFGRGWENGAMHRDELVKLYSRSRINLGFAGIGHSHRLMCLKARDFEVPMSGGLYLTQDNPELGLVFQIGTEIMTYRNAADCARTIRHLLDHPEQCAAIRQAARSRCLRDHTYEQRWTQVFRLADLLK